VGEISTHIYKKLISYAFNWEEILCKSGTVCFLIKTIEVEHGLADRADRILQLFLLLFRSTQNQVNRWTKSLFWFLHVKLVSNTLWPCQNINWLGDMKLTSINYSRYLFIYFSDVKRRTWVFHMLHSLHSSYILITHVLFLNLINCFH